MIVHASADGVVSFAGPIGGQRYVSIDHPGGIRTTYSYLASIDVVAGRTVAQGDRLGTTGDRLHFGARRYGAYIDPASLFERREPPGRSRLVAIDHPWT
jgi:murein DD-endopeptidase MepM/ murein hydrolase activator NlpD